MSFILDALNRSDSDRTADPDVPGIQSVHGPQATATSPLWMRLVWPALALLFAAIAVGNWWTTQQPEPSDAAPAQAAPPAAAPVPAAQPAASITAARAAAPSDKQPSRMPAPSEADRANIAALYNRAPETAPTSPQATAPVAVPQPAPAPSPVPRPAVAPTPAPAALDVDALAKAAQAELDTLQTSREPLVEHSAPFVNELRQSVKDDIPSVFYNAHNWSRDPARRSVILNKREFREGQQVKPGLRLVEILEDGIVLDFRGTEFRLRSLNSWVNL